MLVKNLGVNALLPMLCRLRFSKSFHLDDDVYCDLNNSTLDFRLVLSKSFLNFEIVLVVIVQLLCDVIHQVDLFIKLDKTDKYKPTLIVKDTMEQT